MKSPRSILITGASSGIGEALAREYACPGVFLALSGRNQERLDAVAAYCRNKGVIVSAEIVSILTDDKALGIAHLRASDNKFHEFSTSFPIKSTSSTGSTLTRTVDKFFNTFETPTNRYYQSLTDFLDFTESNPFGDP